jgi:hypothetical protein
MNLNDDVVYRRLRFGPLGQLHPGRSRSLVRYYDSLHGNFLLGHYLLAGNVAALENLFDISYQGHGQLPKAKVEQCFSIDDIAYPTARYRIEA